MTKAGLWGALKFSWGWTTQCPHSISSSPRQSDSQRRGRLWWWTLPSIPKTSLHGAWNSIPPAPCESCPTRRLVLPPGGASLWKGHGGESSEPALFVTRASPSGADGLWWIRQITQVLEPGENCFFFFSIYKRGRRPTVSYPALWTLS